MVLTQDEKIAVGTLELLRVFVIGMNKMTSKLSCRRPGLFVIRVFKVFRMCFSAFDNVEYEFVDQISENMKTCS